MTNPTPHGQVPKALRLAEQYDHGDPVAHGNAWKAAVCTELRRQHTRIAELEYELEAAQRLRKTLDIDPGDVNDPSHPRYIAGFKSGHAAGRRRAAPAASPTFLAEQQTQPGAVYAELPEPDFGPGRYLGKAIGDAYAKDQMRDFADRTHALRMQQAQSAGPCAICGSDEPFTGTCGSGDPRALCQQAAPKAAPAGFVPVAAFDRLHAHAESLAARLLAAEQAAPAGSGKGE